MIDIRNIPITNISQAKAYFFSMGCSHFHMSRESFDRYSEYKSLNISEKTEIIWRKEETEAMFDSFSLDNKKELWIQFSSLANQIEGTAEEIGRMADLAGTIQANLPLTEVDIGCFISSITGSNANPTHGGLIELAHRKGCYDARNKFINVCIYFLLKAIELELEPIFVYGYFIDVVEHYRLDVDKKLLHKFRQYGDIIAFHYYYNGAKNGNVFSMRMLAKCYIETIGCEKNLKEARRWLKKAADKGNELAKSELKTLKIE